MPVSRQPVFEILDMRKIDEAFSDSLKTPCNVIPIQDVLLVNVRACIAAQDNRTIVAGDSFRKLYFLQLVEADETKTSVGDIKIQLLTNAG